VYELAALNVNQAETGYQPNLSVQGVYASGNASTGAYGGAVEKTALLNLQQLVYNGGRVIAQIRGARAGAMGAKRTYQRQLQTLTYNVAQAYYDELQAEGQFRLQLEIVDQDLAQERLISAQISAGTAAPVDLETAEIPTAQARVAVVRAQGSALAAAAAFAAVLGLPANAEVQPIGDNATLSETALPPKTPLDYSVAAQQALSMRPDYRAAIDQVDSLSESVRAFRLQRAPALSLVAQGGYEGFGSVASPLAPVDSIGAAVTLPVFDQNLTNVQVAQAAAQLDQAKAQTSATQVTVFSDVRQSLVQLVAAQAALDQSAIELAKARDVLKATQLQYRAGQTSLPLLLNAQTQLATAENDHLVSLYALRQAEQTYLYALGENDVALAGFGK